MLESIVNACQQNVKALVLDGFEFRREEIAAEKLTTSLNSIESLALNRCTMKKLTWCNMNNLKILKMNQVEVLDSNFWEIKCKSLVSVEFNNVDIDEYDLESFIASVPSIKRLSILKCCHINTSIFSLLKSLKNIKHFEFQLNQASQPASVHQTDLLHLASLKKLKSLKLNCDYQTVKPLIDGFYVGKVAIEHLELAQGPLDMTTIQAICKLNSIKVLKFNDMYAFTDDLLAPISTKLQQIERLSVKTGEYVSQQRITEFIYAVECLKCMKIDAPDFTISGGTFDEILNVAKTRTNKLDITIFGEPKREGLKVLDEWKNGPRLTIHRTTKDLFPHYALMDSKFDTDDECYDGNDEVVVVDAEAMDASFADQLS